MASLFAEVKPASVLECFTSRFLQHWSVFLSMKTHIKTWTYRLWSLVHENRLSSLLHRRCCTVWSRCPSRTGWHIAPGRSAPCRWSAWTSPGTSPFLLLCLSVHQLAEQRWRMPAGAENSRVAAAACWELLSEFVRLLHRQKLPKLSTLALWSSENKSRRKKGRKKNLPLPCLVGFHWLSRVWEGER